MKEVDSSGKRGTTIAISITICKIILRIPLSNSNNITFLILNKTVKESTFLSCYYEKERETVIIQNKE